VRPMVEIEGCRVAHRVLSDRLEELTERAVRQPSRLPGWDVAHVLAHIARNADSVVRRLQGAIDDQVMEQYVGGPAGRVAEIEQSAGLPVGELVAYVRASADEVDRIVERVPDSGWDRRSRSVGGEERPARFVVFSRWREVEVHHVDLGLGYQPADWPEALVASWLPDVVAALPGRTDPRELLAWALGRAAAPPLGPWG